jgi:hypothetical protein
VISVGRDELGSPWHLLATALVQVDDIDAILAGLPREHLVERTVRRPTTSRLSEWAKARGDGEVGQEIHHDERARLFDGRAENPIDVLLVLLDAGLADFAREGLRGLTVSVERDNVLADASTRRWASPSRVR